jgi:glycosyltransferase involved in cell wall biosynthesis
MCVFAGHRRDMPELYALMDVCVLASHREGFPRTVMEASAMAVPVVATNIRGCRTAVDDGHTGILVPVRDADSLARAIATLLDDPALRRRMGGHGRQHAVWHFDQRRIFATVLETYDRQLAARGGHIQ